MSRRRPIIIIMLVGLLLLGGCTEIEDLSRQADVSRLEEAEFYGDLQQTVAQVQIGVLFIGMINLLGGWKLGRFGLMLNGFVIGGLILYTWLRNAAFVDDQNIMLGLTIAGGVLAGVLAFYAYNLMALIIGGVIGTTLMGGAWVQVVENVPPQVLVFITTFISALVMFVVFRLFLVAFSALLGATLLMLAVPFEALWVIPVAGVGILLQSGIALLIHDDIFRNLKGDLGAAISEAFAEVLGPFGWLRDRQRGEQPSVPVAEARSRPPVREEPRPAPPYQPPAHHQPAPRYNPPPPPVYQPPPPQQPYQPPSAPQQPYQSPNPPAYQPPASAPQQPYRPPVNPPYQPPPAPQQPFTAEPTRQNPAYQPGNLQLVLSDGRVYPMGGTQITVGRNADNTIVVNDPEVSGHHLILSVQPEGVVAWDNHSTNGTYLNGTRLEGSRRLMPDDTLQIGDTTLRIVRRDSGVAF